ncbi:hypothetical protein AV530_012820 [Patagioenas fasciata monilis]|uniref:Uncharacterized protein n=1 Tax=Patagioenas fasciata monilis TaxID=372326 RepID=A0A1V4J941_PATFA|nr:hypothetical protein AV530_012820 [Patagioenas fasciata monilis]
MLHGVTVTFEIRRLLQAGTKHGSITEFLTVMHRGRTFRRATQEDDGDGEVFRFHRWSMKSRPWKINQSSNFLQKRLLRWNGGKRL